MSTSTQTPTDVTCPAGHEMTTTVRARSLHCRCGQNFYVRADGTTRHQDPQPARPEPAGPRPFAEPDDQADPSVPPVDLTEPPSVDDRATRPRVIRVRSYELPPRPEQAPVVDVAPDPVPDPVPHPEPAEQDDDQATPVAGPSSPHGRPSLRETWRRRRQAAAARAAQKPRSSPYPDLFDW